MARDDTRLLVVAGGVTGELEDLGGEVLEDGGEVDCRSGSSGDEVRTRRLANASSGRTEHAPGAPAPIRAA